VSTAAAACLPWVRRPDLVMQPVADNGPYVLKDPRTGGFYNLGVQEHFLLAALDGRQSAQQICTAFAERFGQPLTVGELEGFLRLAADQGFLQALGAPAGLAQAAGGPVNGPAGSDQQPPPSAAPAPRQRQSLLYWRKRLFDPDRLLSALAPKLWFLWTPAFLAGSLACMVLAAIVVCANREELTSSFANAMHWRTVVLVYLTLLVTIACHEFSHGLTCKHYGGEVHEIGVLMILLMPCFYCNVSDAWLFREKSKRLWVTLAGGYCDLCLWAVAVLVWRLTLRDGLVNYLAWVVLSVLGARMLLNFNPLIKLDGYYLLSDLAEIPNLQQQGTSRALGTLRWLLWGGPRPPHQPRRKFLLTYGLANWLFSLGILVFLLFTLFRFLEERWGWLGIACTALLGVLVLRGFIQGLVEAEVTKMILTRRKRAFCWAGGLGAVAAFVALGRMDDRVGGVFKVHPVVRTELRAPVAGFLQEVTFAEGQWVSPGQVVLRLEVPNLDSHICQRRAEVREAEARLRLLKAGPRPQEIVAQRLRVQRARNWCDLARRDLAKAQQSFDEEMGRFDRLIAEHRAEMEYAAGCYFRCLKLRGTGAMAEDEYQQIETKLQVSKAHLEQALAQKRGRQAVGAHEAEVEVGRRQRELAEAEATLTLLEAGARPEEIDAEQARLTRAGEELRYLEGQQLKQVVTSPIAGIMTTPRLAEKVGQYFREGELICAVEELSLLEAEISLAEHDTRRIQPGQEVELKVRSHLFETFTTKVDRIAPRAVGDEARTTVAVYCKLEDRASELRPGMLGYGRICCGRRSIAGLWTERALRFLRTEFWW
jgi:putative peptide zinc metalloprotease protein